MKELAKLSRKREEELMIILQGAADAENKLVTANERSLFLS